MKSTNFLIISLIFYCISNTSLAQSIELFHPLTGDLIEGDEIPNILGFRVVDLPELQSNGSSQEPGWKYHWNFGDCSAPSANSQTVHYYPAEKRSYRVTLTVTPIYSDQDTLVDVHYPAQDSTFQVNKLKQSDGSDNPPIVLEEGTFINLNPVRMPKPNDLFTVVMPYQNPDSNGAFYGQIELQYPTGQLNFLPDEFQSCHLTTTYGHDADEGILSFQILPMQDQEKRILEFPFQTSADIQVGDTVTLTVKFQDINSPWNTYDTLKVKTVNSHDPNQKTVDKEELCQQDNLIYTIDFENDGEAPASMVMIMDHIDDKALDIGSIHAITTSLKDMSVTLLDTAILDHLFNPMTFQSGSQRTLTVIKDNIRNKVAFVIHNVEINSGSGGSISYSIATLNNLPALASFGREAHIFFDNNPPVITNAAVSHVINCPCKPAPGILNSSWIDEVHMNNFSLISGNNQGYGNFRPEPVKWFLGSMMNFQMSSLPAPGFGHWRAWIDVNENGDFTPDELILDAPNQPQVQNITDLPTLAYPGKKFLRIVFEPVVVPGPCSVVNGEMEDYAVQLIDTTIADLETTHLRSSSRLMVPGEPLTFYWKLSNTGYVTSSPTINAFFLSDDPTLDGSDSLLGTQMSPALQAGGSLADSMVMHVDAPTAPGYYYIILQSDFTNQSVENNELNNTRTLQIRIGNALPDLRVTSGYIANKLAMPGQAGSVSCIVKNTGKAAAPNTNLGIYLSDDDRWSTGDSLIGTVPVSAIAPGDEKFCSAISGFEIPEGTSSGNYYLVLSIDDQSQLAEEHEGNNITAVQLEITDAIPYTRIPYYEDFESGIPEACWKVLPGNNDGFVKTDTNYLPPEGRRCLLMGSNSSSITINELMLHVNMHNLNDIYLSFDLMPWYTAADTSNALLFSNDAGKTFTRIWDMPTDTILTPNEWGQVVVSLDSLLAEHELIYGDSSVLCLRSLTKEVAPNDGIGMDRFSLQFVPPGASPKLSQNREKEHISNLATIQDVKLFPNPAGDFLSLLYEVTGAETLISLSITDIRGQVVGEVFSAVKHGSGLYRKRIHTGQLNSGTYLLNLSSNRQQFSRRLIIVH